jgi:hypothetical protein
MAITSVGAILRARGRAGDFPSPRTDVREHTAG